MAKKGGPGKPFKPGQSGNPNGRPPLPEEIKKARQINKAEIEILLNKFIDWPLEQLAQFVMNKQSPVLETLVARILLEAIKKGDHVRLEWVFQRLVGKVEDKINHTGNLSFHQQLVNFINNVEPQNTERIANGIKEKSDKKDT